jgi:Domain of unknown function (DUF6259)
MFHKTISILGIILAALLSSQISAAEPEFLSLESKPIQLVLQRAPFWHLHSIRLPGSDFAIQPSQPIPLYQLEWFEKGSLLTLGSNQARVLSAEKNLDTLVIRFSHDAQNLQVECKTWMGRNGLVWNASFRNGSNTGRPAIFRYPGIAFPSSSEPLQAVLSVADGVRIRNVFSHWKENEIQSWDYPGMLSSQMSAWYGKAGGLMLYAADSAGYYKGFRVQRYQNHIIPTFEHIVVGFKDANFTLPYPTVMAPFSGGWESAADLYRDWAVQQPWCNKKIRERGLPSAVSQPSFVLCNHIRLAKGREVKDESSSIPNIGAAFGQALGMPITQLFFSWEKHGPWIAPDYFPPYPSKAKFDQMTQRIHSSGNRTMLYLSGLNITLAKTPRHGAKNYQAPDSIKESIRSSAIVGRDLKILTQGKDKEGVGKKWILCPTTKAAKTQVLNGVQKALELGVDIIQIDQVVGGGTPPCFQESHGHPWAGLNQSTHGFADILRQSHGITSQKGAALSIEGPGEFFIPYLDIVHTRENVEGVWPRDGKGMEGIPLFSYLYHDYLLGYAGDAYLLTEGENKTMAIYSQVMNLLAGRYPAGSLWMHNLEYKGIDPELKKILLEIASIWKSEAKPFLMFGQAQRIPYEFPEHTISYNAFGYRHQFKIPIVLSKGYRFGGKEIAILINSTLEKQFLDLGPLKASQNLRALWPVHLQGKPLDTKTSMPIQSHEIVILERTI